MTTLDQAIQQMMANGMPPFPDGVPRVNTDRIVRYGPKKNAWYRLYEFVARNGKRYITGAYGIWGQIDTTKIETDWEGVDQDERERLERSLADAAEKEEKKRLERAQFAANRAVSQWNSARAEGQSPYLERKGVKAAKGLRFFPDGTLLVPMLRVDDEEPRMVGVQKIAPDGTKRFNKGMEKAGAAAYFGKAVDGKDIALVEGLATGLSVREATNKGFPVFIAFDAGNIIHVAKILRKKYPESRLIFLADDDWLTICPRHKAEGAKVPFRPGAENRPAWCQCNPGLSKAMQAAAHVNNGVVVSPRFRERYQISESQSHTDFNDLHAAEGLAVVAVQIEEGTSTPTKAVPAKKKKSERQIEREKSTISMMLERYTLIYGTETVFDWDRRRIVRLAALRAAYGTELVKWWQGSDKRKMVDESAVVFDPGGPLRPESGINLFDGFELKPRADKEPSKLLQLLYFLVSEDDHVFDWVLKWLAYPLQHPGAKLKSAIVMHGDDGAGKNQFFAAIRAIYGKYGGTIGQTELESQFNGWISQKLFLIANEVVSRQELRHHVGKLKTLTSDEELQVNQKMLPARLEANHVNLVYFSNELQPLWINRKDRRNLIVHTPPPRDPAYYMEIGGAIAEGEIERLFHYLLKYDLGDFTDHTKPIHTSAREALVELGMTSSELFWRDLHGEALPLPYEPCLSEDLYRGYTTWCTRNGERMPSKINRFSAEFMAMNGVRRVIRRIGGDKRQRTIFLMGDRPQEKDESKWVGDGVENFRQKLNSWRSGDE